MGNLINEKTCDAVASFCFWKAACWNLSKQVKYFQNSM